MGNFQGMLRHFQGGLKIFLGGPYPLKKFTLVDIFSGGIENFSQGVGIFRERVEI